MFRAAMILTFALGASTNVWALRVLEQPEMSYEVAMANVTLPASPGGTLSFRACDQCRFVAYTTSTDTHYFVSGRELSFVDFTAAVAEIRKNSTPSRSPIVGVFVEKQSQHVNRIVVQPPRG
jgi:hypothetical protein